MADRITEAPKLELIITACIGSDHTDLDAANKRNRTVAEVTSSNSIRQVLEGRAGAHPTCEPTDQERQCCRSEVFI